MHEGKISEGEGGIRWLFLSETLQYFQKLNRKLSSMFVFTEITTFCGRSLRLITTVNFKLLVVHGFINHWLLLLLR